MSNTRTCEIACRHGAGPFFGRFLISLIFILSGIGKIFGFQEAVESLRGAGIQGAEAYITVGLLLEIIGGLLVLLGWHTRLGVYLLMIFLLPTTLLLHAFWNLEGMEMKLELANFLKNLTIYGGLLLILSYGPGRWSFDALKNRHDRTTL